MTFQGSRSSEDIDNTYLGAHFEDLDLYVQDNQVDSSKSSGALLPVAILNLVARMVLQLGRLCTSALQGIQDIQGLDR